MAYYRESSPRPLTNWRLYRDQVAGGSPANVGTEFAGSDAPKLKFLFTVSFEFGETLRTKLSAGSDDMGSATYGCKNVTRPNININYVDVNSYNYRFKVATKTDYGQVSLTLYDDNKNTAHNLFTKYLYEISPISRIPPGPDYKLTDQPMQRFASLGPLPTMEAAGLIQRMRVTHHVNSNYDDDPNSVRWVRYDYANPKIQSFSLDELDMSVSDASAITINFVYDSVRVTSNITSPEFAEVGTVETL